MKDKLRMLMQGTPDDKPASGMAVEVDDDLVRLNAWMLDDKDVVMTAVLHGHNSVRKTLKDALAAKHVCNLTLEWVDSSE